MKKQQQIKRAHRLIQGLIICWTDDAALTDKAEIRDEKISHARPILRLQAKNIWHDYQNWIMDRKTLLWRIDFTVVFRHEDGRDQLEQRRVIARAKLMEIAHECYPALEQATAEGNGVAPTETRFRVQCLGDRPATEADFEDFLENHEAA